MRARPLLVLVPALGVVVLLAACSYDNLGTAVPNDGGLQIVDGAVADADGGVADAEGGVDTGTGVDAAPPDPQCNGVAACRRVVFVTAGTTDGSFRGLAGATKKCQDAAKNAVHSRVIGRSFVPWLSTATGTATSTILHGTGPYMRVDGLRVAASFDALVGAPLENPIALDQNGTPVAGAVWTGSTETGLWTGLSCVNDWIANDTLSVGTTGVSNSTTTWSQASTQACNLQAHLYCIEL